MLADVTARDGDGDLIATPDEWDEDAHGPAPKIRIHVPRKARPGEAAGVGDRVLLRVDERPKTKTASAIAAASSRSSTIPSTACSGFSAKLPHGGGRLEPVDKKMLGKELAIPAGATADAEDGDLVAVETARAPRLGLPTGRVVERLGSLKSERAVSLIAIHAHGIPQVFRRETQARGGSREARNARTAARTGGDVPLVTIDPPDAKDHDDAVHAEPDTAANNRGGFIVNVAIADVAHYVTPGSALDREALVRGNSVYFPDRVVPMLPERISNDLCSLRPREDRAALAVRMVIGADGRKRSHTFHRIMMRSAAKLSYQQAQFADRRPHRRGHRAAGRAGAGAALRRLRGAGARAHRAPAARSRSARAQDPAQGRRHRRPRRSRRSGWRRTG